MTLTKDDVYLFSGDIGGKVVVWFVKTWVPLCFLKVNNAMEIDKLIISNDNSHLVALDN